jgi:putative DNA primase/helicase
MPQLAAVCVNDRVSGQLQTFDEGRGIDMLVAYDRVRKICRAAAKECNKPAEGKQLKSGKTVAAVERLARSDRRIIASTDQWDADPWLLNTPKGIVDLRTGRLTTHRPDSYMTKITAVAPDDKCPTRIWLAFLKRVTSDNTELIAYLQRMAGYLLTGATSEHALFFFFGLGANGKTTLINVLSGILCDYHQASPIETFTVSSVDRHPTNWQDLSARAR